MAGIVRCPTCGEDRPIVKVNSMVDYCDRWHGSNGYRVNPATGNLWEDDEWEDD